MEQYVYLVVCISLKTGSIIYNSCAFTDRNKAFSWRDDLIANNKNSGLSFQVETIEFEK
jgi:hypothetical protein